MSDFLTNLAARALAAPTLRPRTRSRFEPEPEGSPWLPSAAPAAEAATHDEQSGEPPIGRRALARREPDDLTSRKALPAQTPSRADDPQAVHTERVELHEPAARPATTHRETHHHTTERVVVEREVEHRETTIQIEATHDVERVPPPAAPRTEVQPRETAAPQAHDEPPQREAEPRHRHDEEPPRIDREKRDASPQFPPPEARRPSSPQRTIVETREAPEPVIHVSIGRVEVRATAPAVTPQRTRPRNAPMTLEDYAARRKEKGRP